MLQCQREKAAELVHLLRGTFAIHDRYFVWLARTPLKDYLEIPLDANPSFDRNPADSQLALLVPELTARDARVGMICCQVPNVLRRVPAIVAMSNQTISVKIVHCWLGQVPDAYNILMSENEHEAPSCFGALLRHASPNWFVLVHRWLCEEAATILLQAEVNRVSLSGENADRTFLTTREALPTCRRGHHMQHSWCTVSLLDDPPQTSY
jgi:hypothetical protein